MLSFMLIDGSLLLLVGCSCALEVIGFADVPGSRLVNVGRLNYDGA